MVDPLSVFNESGHWYLEAYDHKAKKALTFRVDRRATKPEIKNAVESIFQVKVDAVHTANYLGKMARRGRHEGRKPSWKKAYVTLKHGEKPVDYGEAI